ncbi:MAG: carboxypeptidase-like regulatory domain-containing protein [Gemmatimonas sp.]|jgi:hypothetical protein|uniref:carboxypeptidase-like regulatory domain-containing protein n=1 Tax=Gemmatimonas sp. TaxID=1962908 RepID=UPI00391FB7D7|nr:carboxypeptidase-like regulatory domain-containing protein [Gemmatimonadota bacterium]
MGLPWNLCPRRRAATAFVAVLSCTTFAGPSPLLAQTGTIRGTVRSTASGRPVGGASVTVPAAARQTRTDSLGRFVLNALRDGDQKLVVQAVGFAPARAVVTPTAGDPLEVDVDLAPLPQELQRVVAVAPRDAPRNIAYAEFEQRRAMELVRLLTREELVHVEARSLDGLLRARVSALRTWELGSARIAGSARGNISLSPRANAGQARCYVQVIVDNVIRYETGGTLPPFDLRSLDPAMIAGVEFYTPSSTPAEFNRGSTAAWGTLLIWLPH